MCGIAGIYYRDRSRPVDVADVRRMCDAMVHRGPDDEGVFVEGNVGLGMRRLAIIDLEGGAQPIFNEDRSVVTVFNGEIYNHLELRAELEAKGYRFATRSDTEVLVHGYEEWDDGLPGRLNGMFAFSVLDRRRGRLLLARDQVGVKPLYVYETAELVAWASEVKCLLTLPGFSAELDEAALGEYLTLGYVPAPRSMFRGVRKVPSAATLAIEDGRVTERRYWDLRFETVELTESEWSERLLSEIDASVSRQLMSDVPLGAFLSGGLDSSAIVASMRHLGVGTISTYAIGFGADDAFHSELGKAARVAEHFETDHHEILVEPQVADLFEPLVYHLDEPVTDTSFVVTYLVSKLARETVTVILSGVGGDEILGGYRRYLWPFVRRWHERVPRIVDHGLMRPVLGAMPVDRGSRLKALARYARGYLDHAEKPDGLRYQGYVEIFGEDLLARALTPPCRARVAATQIRTVADYYAASGSSSELESMLYADLKTSLVDSLLAFTDKMTMAVSLEARVPLLDLRLIELAAEIPASMKVSGFRGLKRLMRRSLSGRLPDGIVDQRKQGFGTPVSRWFRDSLRPLVTDMLSEDRLSRRGIFEPRMVASIVDDHMQERADHSEHILAMLMLELWQERFLDGAATTA